MKRIGLIILGAIIILSAFWYFNRSLLSTTILLAGNPVTVELAVTPQEKEQGLSGRSELKAGTGMLFPYDHKEKYEYCMRGMKFPLDFVWIADRTIVDFTPNVPVLTNGSITVVKPNVPVDQVLELNAGDIQKLGLQIGDTAIIKH